MGKSKIEWTDKTWNPVTGCTKVSAGCKNCYAERMSKRLAGRFGYPADDPFKVTLHPGRLEEPLRWRKPCRVFVCSMGDLFHDDVPDDFIDYVFAVMALVEKHTFIVLTKRPKRMLEYMKTADWGHRANTVTDSYIRRLNNSLYSNGEIVPPLPNIHLGVSVEDQATANERIPYLLQTPAAKRFISIEPMLGPVDLTKISWRPREGTIIQGTCLGTDGRVFSPCGASGKGLDGVILGGESGPGARPMHPDWARKVRDDCKAAGVAFFFKQLGEWAVTQAQPGGDLGGDMRKDKVRIVKLNGLEDGHFRKGDVLMRQVGKNAAGALLDGQEYKETP